jgi:hypothetical protein
MPGSFFTGILLLVDESGMMVALFLFELFVTKEGNLQ